MLPYAVVRSMAVEIVLATVDFDDDPVLMINKIEKVTSERRLTAKMKSLLLQQAKLLP